MPIYFRYAAFAAIATCINLAVQAVGLGLYAGPQALGVAMVLGTGAGLVTKYALDKRWIFYDPARGVAAHGRRLTLYTATGVATTALFWGMEYAFDGLTADGRYRFLGAALGLTIGYVVKYQLDRKFVFAPAAA